MMPVAGNTEQAESVDYKKKYKALKRKLKFLVYEHESFLEELKKAQRKLLKVSRDRSFLLDRLLQYEKNDDSSSDSEVTASSDSDADGPKDGVSTKKRKMSGGNTAPVAPTYNAETPGVLAAVTFANTIPPQAPQPAAVTTLVTPPSAGQAGPTPKPDPSALLEQLSSVRSAQQPTPKSTPEPPKKRQKVTKKTPKTGTGTTGRPTVAQALQQQQLLHKQQLQQLQQQQQQQQAQLALAEAMAPGHMTREELERHLEYKQSTKPQFMSIDKAPNMLPDDIFNDDNSFSDSDAGDRTAKEEEDLVIDMALDG